MRSLAIICFWKCGSPARFPIVNLEAERDCVVQEPAHAARELPLLLGALTLAPLQSLDIIWAPLTKASGAGALTQLQKLRLITARPVSPSFLATLSPTDCAWHRSQHPVSA